MHTLAKPRVVLAEDDAAMRCMLVEAFDEAGYEVQEFSEGSSLKASLLQAIKEPDQGSFDIVVSDIRMPGMTGLEVLKELRAKNWNKPIVFITAFGSKETHQQALALNADVLNKPFDIDDMIDHVRQRVQESQRASKTSFKDESEGLSRNLERACQRDNFNIARSELETIHENLFLWERDRSALFDALKRTHEAILGHIHDLKESGFLEDIQQNSLWLVARAKQLTEDWFNFERKLFEVIEDLALKLESTEDLLIFAPRIIDFKQRLDTLRNEEIFLLFERFNEPPALD